MTTATLYAAIRARLADDWTACPVIYENESAATPESSGIPQPWMMVEITGAQFDQRSIGAETRGANYWREVGTLHLHIFVPANTGSDTARGLIHQAVDLFQGTGLGSTTFLGSRIGMGQASEVNGGWWRLSADIDFERDA